MVKGCAKEERRRKRECAELMRAVDFPKVGCIASFVFFFFNSLASLQKLLFSHNASEPR